MSEIEVWLRKVLNKEQKPHYVAWIPPASKEELLKQTPDLEEKLKEMGIEVVWK